MKQVLIPIDCIDPNPFQPASARDQQKILDIAVSLEENLKEGIGTNGLNQVPTARKVGDRYQLAFGHHRHEAFVELAGRGREEFTKMPLNIENLTDQQMFEAMATENLQRREISFIEEAQMYNTYMTIFHKNSVETGERFSKSEEHIRGRIMFLQLPDAAQEKIRKGEMNVTTARAMVQANKVLGREGVVEVLKRMDDENDSETYDSPQEAIEDVLRESPNARRMEYRVPWMDEKKFPVKYLPALSRKLAAEILDVAKEDVARSELLDQLMQRIQSGMDFHVLEFASFDADQLDKIHLLINPPACSSCPFHTFFDGTHYCGIKVCYERKEHAWAQAEVEKVWKATGIPLYVNEAKEGKTVDLNRWSDADQKLFRERHADLRLRPTSRSIWNNFDGLPNNVALVAVGKTAEKRLKAEEKKEEKQTTERNNYDLDQKIKKLMDQHVHLFLWNSAVPAFEGLLESMTNLPFMLYLYDEIIVGRVQFIPGMDDKAEQIEQIENAKRKADGLKQLRRLMIAEVLDVAIDWDTFHAFNGAKKVILEFVKRAQKHAEKWNWKLSKEFVAQGVTAQEELDAAIKALTK